MSSFLSTYLRIAVSAAQDGMNSILLQRLYSYPAREDRFLL